MWETILVKWNISYCTSRDIAKNFNKRHDNILQTIEKLECSKEFSHLNFKESKYIKRWKEYKEYFITRDWFSILVMWFTWKEAMQFKEKYIIAFNKMEKALSNISNLKTLPEYEQKYAKDRFLTSYEYEMVKERFNNSTNKNGI